MGASKTDAVKADIIQKYEVLYAVRTGLTVLIPKTATLDCGIDVPVRFRISPENPRDLIIIAEGRNTVLKDMDKSHLDAALARGSLMIYELKEDEVVRCTPCTFQSA